MYIQYAGFNVAPSSRIYNFDEFDTQEAREFTVEVQSETFRSGRLKVQDGLDICFARLKQELQGEAQKSRVEAHLSIGERDIQEYLVRTALAAPAARKQNSTGSLTVEPNEWCRPAGLTPIELNASCNHKKSSPLRRRRPQMINARSFVFSILGAVLSAASLICAQDVKPSEARVILQRPPVIQELELQPQGFLGFSLQEDPVSAPLIYAPDLSRYREFQFGMSLLEVAKQAEMKPSEVSTIHQRPGVIQELEWRAQRSLASSPQADPVTEVLFSFYNGELFRMVINYDQYRTKGLTDEDMVEAISARYGTATRPAAKIILFTSFQV